MDVFGHTLECIRGHGVRMRCVRGERLDVEAVANGVPVRRDVPAAVGFRFHRFQSHGGHQRRQHLGDGMGRLPGEPCQRLELAGDPAKALLANPEHALVQVGRVFTDLHCVQTHQHRGVRTMPCKKGSKEGQVNQHQHGYVAKEEAQ
jgi:hypothetical protein